MNARFLLNDVEREEYCRAVKRIDRLVQEHQLGFAGWLVVNGEFRFDIATMSRDADAVLLPRLRRVGEPNDPQLSDRERTWVMNFRRLLKRWCLDSLVTW